jgi:hypothetical protein
MLSILFSIPFIKRPFFLPACILWIILATSYSLKPLRLKERGKIGLLAVVLAQRAIPGLIIFFAFNYHKWIEVMVFASYVFFRGLSSDINHQLEDYQKDAGTDTLTYAVKSGEQKTLKILGLSIEIEKVLFIICLFIIFFNTSHLKVFGVPINLPILLTYLIIYGSSWYIRVLQGHGFDVNPFIPERKDLFQFVYHPFPTVILPLYLLLILVFIKWYFFIILPFFIVYKNLHSLDVIQRSFLGRWLSRLGQT